MMKLFKLFFSIFMVAMLAFSCSTHALKISGTMEGASNLTVYFDKLGVDNSSKALETTTTNANGAYALHFDEPIGPGPYRLRFGGRSADLMINGTETDIKVDGNLDGLKKYKYTVEGSLMSNEYVSTMKEFSTGNINVDKLTQMISKDLDPLVSMAIAVKIFKESPNFSSIHRAVCNRLSDQYPNLDCTKTYNDMVAQLEAQSNRNKKKYAVQIGQPAPDIALPDVNGKVRKLSDLKGQVVLLDFLG